MNSEKSPADSAPAAPSDPVAEAPADRLPPSAAFPVVGIGASAGGLEALEGFFRALPVNSGLAFVVVQHLDPSHASLLTEILQRSTVMPVITAEDQLRVLPDCVYVIPPNREIAIFHGVLQLCLPEKPRGQRMPIDAFLRSLAEDSGEYAIGVILSGTGTDGTLGLRAILNSGGLTLVQDPHSARYDGMPVSAIRAGYAMQVLPVEAMGGALLAGARFASASTEVSSAGLNKVLLALRTATGQDFSLYKKSTIARRIERRMAHHIIGSMEDYARYLAGHADEVRRLFQELLINVTQFFRDPDAFDVLKRDLLPALFADKADDYVFRVWIPGCATGEEAYSIAILLHEYLETAQLRCTFQIYATDLDDDAIALARGGHYPPNIVQDLTAERLRRFFTKEEGGYRIKNEIREKIVFAVQNVIKDPPFTRLDLLCCRNLMIYLKPELQHRLILTFHYALKPGGGLFLSASEGIGNHIDLFSQVNRKWRLYRAIPLTPSLSRAVSADLPWALKGKHPMSTDNIKKPAHVNFAELTQRALMQSYAPASVLTDLKGNLLYVYGDTGKFLRPGPGQASLNVVDMARDGLQLELRAALQRAADRQESTLEHEAAIKIDGDYRTVQFSVRFASNAPAGQALLILSFRETVAAPPAPDTPVIPGDAAPAQLRRIDELERHLAQTRDNLQSTIEDQQATNEELRSANEELQSANEELQSTNEEMETSREELQSINEELVTVNSELQAKIEQLADMRNDMKNLLDNINVGTIFLDLNLSIRRFTREATRAYRLVATDIGRALVDIKSRLASGDLVAEARAVLDTLRPYENQVQTLDGGTYLARIQPYRTLENRIAGVVLSFTDITRHAAAEQAVKTSRDLAEAIVNSICEPLLVLDGALKITAASHAFYAYFRVKPEETLGRAVYELGNGQWDIPALRELLENLLPKHSSFDNYEVNHFFPTIGQRNLLLNARRIAGQSDRTERILLIMQENKNAEVAR